MRNDYANWLEVQKYAIGTQSAQLNRMRRIEESYGNLDDHFRNGTISNVISSLQYSTSDERAGKPNPSKIKTEGNIRNTLQSYKAAVVRYIKFLNQVGRTSTSNRDEESEADIIDEANVQRFSLERDMQAALRKNIESLGATFTIADDGAERAVNSGLIDITCEDGDAVVVVELKAGTANSRAIGQILGYMGDIQEEEPEKPVRGILIAHDFDKRAQAAARVVPTLTLKRYSIEFKYLNMT